MEQTMRSTLEIENGEVDSEEIDISEDQQLDDEGLGPSPGSLKPCGFVAVHVGKCSSQF